MNPPTLCMCTSPITNLLNESADELTGLSALIFYTECTAGQRSCTYVDIQIVIQTKTDIYFLQTENSLLVLFCFQRTLMSRAPSCRGTSVHSLPRDHLCPPSGS